MEANDLKLLAIDDNQDNLTALKAVVQDALPGCTLLTAFSGPLGIDLARAEDPDVILLDIVMPGMDGFEVCRRLKADEQLRSIPIVFLTALRTDRENRIKALEGGAEAFLSKPLDEPELVAIVRAMAKIKAANRRQRMEKEQLAVLVAERTRELEEELAERRRAEAEKKEIEDQLQQAQKMEAIGTLAGGIAHDFNNILSVIIGNAEILNFADDNDASVSNGLKQILAASQRAKQLVYQILAFSRHGKQEKIFISLKPIVKESLEFLRASLPSQIELRHYLEPDAGTIMADPSQMQQILMNLCVNAGHAMEKEGGILQVNLSHAALTEEETRLDTEVEPGDFVKLTVADTGHGMGSSVLERMFDPYFTTKEPGKGTGLGLSVVHGIVRSHGGLIKVDSEVGKGTTFTVFLPRAAGFEKVADKPMLPLARGTEKILLVDDEKALADLGQQLLGELGYQVETRSSPIEALEAFRGNPRKFDLVITDLTMPHMSGLTLSRKLLEIRPGMPIILCTGFSEQANEQAASALGICAFLLKPLVIRDIAEAVRKALDVCDAKSSTEQIQ